MIDRAKLKDEARLDGKFLLSTSDPDLSAEDIALGYKNLLEAERAFRDLRPPWSCARSGTGWSVASAPTCCCAGWPCC